LTATECVDGSEQQLEEW